MMVMASYTFGATSSYLVALIVLLRLIAIKRPTSYQDVHRTVSLSGSIIIWVFSLLLSSVFFIVHLSPFVYEASVAKTVFTLIASHGLLTAPIIITVLLYVVLLCSLKAQTANQKVTTHPSTIKHMKAMAKMIHGVVAGLLVCNVPNLLYNAYVVTMIAQGRRDDIYSSNVLVCTVI